MTAAPPATDTRLPPKCRCARLVHAIRAVDSRSAPSTPIFTSVSYARQAMEDVAMGSTSTLQGMIDIHVV